MIKKIKLLLIFLPLLSFSCIILPEDPGLNFDEDKFTSNYSLWKSSENSNYEFTQEYFSNHTGPMPEIKIKVYNNQFVSYYVISNDHEVDKENYFMFQTIEEVYEKINSIVEECKRSIASDNDPMIGADIKIEYDEVSNYPTKIDCSGIYKGKVLGGLSFHLELRDFKRSN